MNKDIYDALRERILYLDYHPGQILNENTLAREFNVSRTPMREVLNRLEWGQLARIIPRTGTMVTEIEFQKMMNAFQARLAIDGLVARLAAEHMSAASLTDLDSLADEGERLRGNRQRKALVAIDLRFRDILHAAANNPVLGDIAQYLYDLTFRLWYIILDRGEWDEEVDALVDEIRQLRSVFEKKDGVEAERIRRDRLMKHLERIRQKFLGTPA
jgi:DNA-binding GntR family transcriptional regulator